MCGCSVTAGRVQEAWPQGMVLLELRGASASLRSLVTVEAPGPVPKEPAWVSLGWAKEPCIQQILLRIQQGNLSSPPTSPACQHPQEANLAFLPRCLLLSPQEHLEHLFLGSVFSCSFPKLPASSPRGTLVLLIVAQCQMQTARSLELASGMGRAFCRSLRSGPQGPSGALKLCFPLVPVICCLSQMGPLPSCCGGKGEMPTEGAGIELRTFPGRVTLWRP